MKQRGISWKTVSGVPTGVLQHAVILSSNEAMKRLSDLRLGVYLGILNQVTLETLNEITYSNFAGKYLEGL